MIYVIDILKYDGVLYGITEDYEEIEFKRGDKFVLEGNKYRVGLEGNYFAYIPWWEYIWIFHKIADLVVGKRNYDY